MRADRFLRQASSLFCIIVLFILSLSFAHIPSVNAAPGEPVHDTPEAGAPVKYLQTGPDVQVAITAAFQSVNAGEPVSFTITVVNQGPGAAQAVILTSNLPNVNDTGWTVESSTNFESCSIASNLLTCNIGPLAESGWFYVTVGATTGALQACGTLEVKATVSAGNEPPENTGNNSVTASTDILCPALVVTKTAGVRQVVAGTPVSFSISVVNNGKGAARGVLLSDPLPGAGKLNWQIDTPNTACTIANGVLSCPLGDLASGARVDVQISAPTSDTSCGSYPNTVTVSAANHSTVEQSATVDVLCTPLLLQKTTDTPEVSAGEPVRFTLSVTNADATAAQAVTLTDTLPNSAGLAWQTVEPVPQGCAINAGILSCTFASLPAGETRVVTIQSATTFNSCGPLTNTAHLTDAAGRAMDASASLNILCPQLSVAKTADLPEAGVGAQAGFTILVSNTGTGSGLNVHLADALPAGVTWAVDHPACTIENNNLACNWPTLLPQAQETIHITGVTTISACGTLNNRAVLTAANFATLESSASITVTCPDLTVEKTADKSPVRPGDTAGFTVVVTNIGTGTAREVSLRDTLPGGLTWSVDNTACTIAGQEMTCSLGDMPSGGQPITLKVAGIVGEACGTLTNQVTVSASNEPAQLTTNNAAQASIEVQCLQNLLVSKTAHPTFDQVYTWSISKTASQTKAWGLIGNAIYIDYSIKVAQTGAQGKNYRVTGQITITNPNPSAAIGGVTITDAVNNGGTCTVKNGENQTIPAGGVLTVDYTCEYPDGEPTAVSGTNTATVTWDPSTGTPDHSATASVDFVFDSGSPSNTGGYQTVTVQDRWGLFTATIGQVTGVSQPPYASKAFNYTFALPVFPGCITYSNTASLKETGQSSSANVTICGQLHTGAQSASYWQKQGQAIIRSAGNNSSCALTPWLRQFAPFQDLSIKLPCPAVANYMKLIIDRGIQSHATMNEELRAQIAATALNIFFSDPKLGGNQLNAPAPIGGYTIDLAHVCSQPVNSACKMVDATSAFNQNASLTIFDALVMASKQSSFGGEAWYTNDVDKISLTGETFNAINRDLVFPVEP